MRFQNKIMHNFGILIHIFFTFLVSFLGYLLSFEGHGEAIA